MNFILLSLCLSILISLTSAFYKQCDCPQCNQYSMKVQRCACCVYLLNGKRSPDTHSILHHQDITDNSNIQYQTLHRIHHTRQSDWRDVYIGSKLDLVNNPDDIIQFLTSNKRGILGSPSLTMDIVPLSEEIENEVRDSLLLEIDDV